jgi:hypothetical protein
MDEMNAYLVKYNLPLLRHTLGSQVTGFDLPLKGHKYPDGYLEFTSPQVHTLIALNYEGISQCLAIIEYHFNRS